MAGNGNTAQSRAARSRTPSAAGRGRQTSRRTPPDDGIARRLALDAAVVLRLGAASMMAVLLAASAAAGAAERGDPRWKVADEPARSGVRGWTVHLDNDLFAFTHEDRDYTAGISVTLGGDEADRNALSGALSRVDAATGFGRLLDPDAGHAHSFEVGLLMFTPSDLDASEPLFDDRPYANLAYVSTSQLTYDPTEPVAHQSSLTLGVLGLPFAEPLHRSVHDTFGGQEPMGYDHQISDGGEPTFRYTVSRYRLLSSGIYEGRPYTVRLGTTASVGYLTEADVELAFKWGNLNVPWWSSLPSASDYAGHPPIKSIRGGRASKLRFQVSAGIDLRARLYNSFLQGQFRSSDVTYSSSRLNHVLFEAWVGVTTVFKNNLSLSYTLRRQTEEIRDGRGARGFTWASIGIAQQF